jgi:amidase
MRNRQPVIKLSVALPILVLAGASLVDMSPGTIGNKSTIDEVKRVLDSEPKEMLIPGAEANAAKTGANVYVSETARSQMDRDLHEVTIAKLHAYYAQGRYSAHQVVSWYLDRIRALSPGFNAFVYVYEKEAVARATAEDAEAKKGKFHGALWGVPVVIKGNTSIRGKITANGWEGYARPGKELVAIRNATIVDKFERAGAVVIGHANMPDLGKSDSNISTLGGRTGNAYDPNFSPGGSSGGVAVAVALNLALIGQGTDTGNSIRNPASNASLVGVFPTQGLVSVAGIHPYDTLLDNTGLLTRTVPDAAVALDVVSGEDPEDSRTAKSVLHKIGHSYKAFLRAGALKGRRFGVPHFILDGAPSVYPNPTYRHRGVSPETRVLFMQAVQKLRAAGATVVIADDILPEEFAQIADSFQTKPYGAAGIDRFLSRYAPTQINSLAKLKEAGIDFPVERFTDGLAQCAFETDPRAASNYYEPHKRLIDMYQSTLRRERLNGFVYPALQVPPNDERIPLPKDYPSDGPYSFTNWVNRLGVPAIVVPAGYYANGLPFGVEFSADFWNDGDLLGYAFAFEQLTHVRHAAVP